MRWISELKLDDEVVIVRNTDGVRTTGVVVRVTPKRVIVKHGLGETAFTRSNGQEVGAVEARRSWLTQVAR